MNHQMFYSELGKLLYAIASVDGKVSKQESGKIHEIVQKRLVPAEHQTDRYGSNVAFYAEIEFDYLDDEISDSESSYDSFVQFVQNHHTACSNQLLDECLEVVKEVAAAYNKTSKKEADLIERLEHTFNQIKTNRSK